MIVSWNWLKEYVRLDMPAETLADRLMFAGLNLESISDVAGDIAIDLEVTSNRPDCLGHIGVAREVAVLFDRELTIPPAQLAETGPAASTLTSVELKSDACPRYIARVIRGVKIGPSPAWMVRRLTTLGIRPINNVVDCTNYVLMECGQPLHAFDFAKLHGGKIVVRPGQKGEKLVAIDGREYELTPDMCIIADADHPVAIAGVMGGLETEIGNETRDVLLEVAEFTSMSVRATARKLTLHSPSSYRFERGVDAHQLEWASRRCAELIVQTAGGELAPGAVSVGAPLPGERAPIVLRFSQIQRILGIDIPRDEVVRILTRLGLREQSQQAESVTMVPPSWRRDLSREIDLIEEAARIHGYEHIPEDAIVPLAQSTQTTRDRVRERAGDVLTAAGFFEAVTLSFVDDERFEAFRPWGETIPLRVEHSTRRRENILRQSLVPSLLYCRRDNENHGNFDARLFEIAKGYLGADPEHANAEPWLLSFVTEQSFAEAKGVIEALVAAHRRNAKVDVRPLELAAFQPGRGCEVYLDDLPWGWLGELSAETRQKLDLRDPVCVAELQLSLLEQILDTSPRYAPIPQFPASQRDLNFVLDEAVTWQELSEVAQKAAGPILERISFAGQYRGPQIPADKKSYVVALHYRGADRTLTTQEVDTAQQSVIAACTEKLGAALR
jgi:phenylalanyl-tRNA synthetase beta chain